MENYDGLKENGSGEQTEESEIIEADDGGEILTDGGRSDSKQKKVKAPVETKEKIEGIGALAKASTSWENTLEVLGTASPDYDTPRVSISLGNSGNVHEASIVISFDPDEARELAEMLQRRADYAEEYTEYRKNQEE